VAIQSLDGLGALSLSKRLDCFVDPLLANELLQFVIASPTQSGVAIQLYSRWMAASLRSSP
jgi:hypothetical protein